MATITPLRVASPFDGPSELWEWINLADGDTALPVRLPWKADKTVQMYRPAGGAFGGAVAFQGTLEDGPSPTAWITLNDSRGKGNPISFTTADAVAVMENMIQYRPNPGAGVTGVTVRLLAIHSR